MTPIVRRVLIFLGPVALLGSAFCGGCAAQTVDESVGTTAVAVLPGKADDYKSPSSREWTLTGSGVFTLDTEWADTTDDEKEAAANDALGARFKAYAHFVNEFVTDKESHGAPADEVPGGFAGLVRDKSLDSLVMATTDDSMSWEFLWSVDMGGPADLLSRLPTRSSGGETVMDVVIPILTDWQLEHGSYPKHFNAETYEGETESVAVSIAPVPDSFDAFPEYGQLIADGKVDMMVLVGGDYNDERWDLKATERIFNWLKSAGWKHPAKAWTDLTLDSPPFTKHMRAAGQDIRLELTLLHADIVADADLDQLRDRVVEGFETMDIVIYDGHAGQDPGYSGVSYHYNPRKAISANELAKLNLPEKYQIFVFNGCKTYNAYPDALYQSETKNTKNLDIISTVSFSWLSMQPFTTSGLLALMFKSVAGEHDPATWIEILTQINKENNANVYYGVHGLDDNPHRNPYADMNQLCQACTADTQCAGIGNRCIAFGWGSACAVECTSNQGCPLDYRCAEIAEGTQIVGHQCLPKNYRCE